MHQVMYGGIFFTDYPNFRSIFASQSDDKDWLRGVFFFRMSGTTSGIWNLANGGSPNIIKCNIS